MTPEDAKVLRSKIQILLRKESTFGAFTNVDTPDVRQRSADVFGIDVADMNDNITPSSAIRKVLHTMRFSRINIQAPDIFATCFFPNIVMCHLPFPTFFQLLFCRLMPTPT